MDPSYFLTHPPHISPEWLHHESLQPSLPAASDIISHRQNWAAICLAHNARILSSRDKYLTTGLEITEQTITIDSGALSYRQYVPIPSSSASIAHEGIAIIYYHGGGIYIGDLDSEDLTCRRLCIALNAVVYSCSYRLMPENTADDALSDAMALFWHLLLTKGHTGFVVIGSSSGGQLAAQVSQDWLKKREAHARAEVSGFRLGNLKGVLLRCPVTCEVSSLPLKYRNLHHSLSPAFVAGGITETCVTAEIRTSAKLPLEEEELTGLPRHWIQLCTNDIFYSDGVCYADALVGKGVEIRFDIVSGWPHTFWLGAPDLRRAVEAENDMIEGCRWLIEA